MKKNKKGDFGSMTNPAKKTKKRCVRKGGVFKKSPSPLTPVSGVKYRVSKRKKEIFSGKRVLASNLPNEDDTAILKEDALQSSLFKREVPFPEPADPQFTFIDLFAGIGGFRLAMQNLGGKCVFTSEWDKEAQKTYMANFGEVPFGDITKEETKKFIPDGFDVLCAGFPCQAFSIAGRRAGFEDTRGTLFFEVAEIIRRKKPKAIFLENVKGLINHNGGRTLETIINVLRNDRKRPNNC